MRISVGALLLVIGSTRCDAFGVPQSMVVALNSLRGFLGGRNRFNQEAQGHPQFYNDGNRDSRGYPQQQQQQFGARGDRRGNNNVPFNPTVQSTTGRGHRGGPNAERSSSRAGAYAGQKDHFSGFDGAAPRSPIRNNQEAYSWQLQSRGGPHGPPNALYGGIQGSRSLDDQPIDHRSPYAGGNNELNLNLADPHAQYYAQKQQHQSHERIGQRRVSQPSGAMSGGDFSSLMDEHRHGDSHGDRRSYSQERQFMDDMPSYGQQRPQYNEHMPPPYDEGSRVRATHQSPSPAGTRPSSIAPPLENNPHDNGSSSRVDYNNGSTSRSSYSDNGYNKDSGSAQSPFQSGSAQSHPQSRGDNGSHNRGFGNSSPSRGQSAAPATGGLGDSAFMGDPQAPFGTPRRDSHRGNNYRDDNSLGSNENSNDRAQSPQSNHGYNSDPARSPSQIDSDNDPRGYNDSVGPPRGRGDNLGYNDSGRGRSAAPATGGLGDSAFMGDPQAPFGTPRRDSPSRGNPYRSDNLPPQENYCDDGPRGNDGYNDRPPQENYPEGDPPPQGNFRDDNRARHGDYREGGSPPGNYDREDGPSPRDMHRGNVNYGGTSFRGRDDDAGNYRDGGHDEGREPLMTQLSGFMSHQPLNGDPYLQGNNNGQRWD